MNKIQNTAAQIAAVAVCEMFPAVQCSDIQEISFGFCCDFSFPHTIHPELHLQIEEKMRQIVREKREIREFEMVPLSARELLKSQGLSLQWEGDGLVRMVQVGSFCNPTIGEGPHLTNSSELAAFKLFPAETLQEGRLRLIGVAFSSKEELKQFLKRWNAYPKIRHEKVGEKLGYFRVVEGNFIWLPKGLRLRRTLLQRFEENFPDLYEVVLPKANPRSSFLKPLVQENDSQSLFELLPIEKNLFKESVATSVGLLDPREGTEIRITSSLDKMKFFLQSIGKTLNLLGFSYSIRLVGRQRHQRELQTLAHGLEHLRWPFERVYDEKKGAVHVQFLVADGLGRMWSAATICVDDFLVCQMIVERTLALGIEMQLPWAI